MERSLLFACFAFVYANANVCEIHSEDQNLPGLEETFHDRDGSSLVIWFTCKIHGSSRNDSGNYTCVARTDEGIFLYNETMDIRITEAGRITSEQDGIHVKMTESQTLTCYVNGYSAFIWQLGFEYGGLDLTNLRITAYVDANGFQKTLNLTSVKRDDDGSYSCAARYPYVPPITDNVVSYHVMPVGARSVLLSWVARHEDPNIRIMYRKNGTEEWCFHSEEVGSRYRVKKIITGLENGTAYRFKIVARTDGGHLPAAYSSWVTTYEKDFTIWITATTLHSISMGWAEGPQKLDREYFWFQLTATYSGGQIMKWLSDSYYTIDGLEPNTSYLIAVTACASANWDGEVYCLNDSRAEQTAVTIDRVINFVPIFTVEDTTPHSITIGWSAPPPELQDHVHQYKVAATRRGEKEAPVYLPKTVNSFNFQNLTSNASYLIKAAACSDYKTQCGSWSSGQDVWTVYAAPKFVPEIDIKDTSIDSISVEWSAPPAELRDPVYQYKVAAIRRGDREAPVYLPKTAHSHVFKNLTSTTSYLVQVAACTKDKMKCGNWSSTRETLTINQVGKTRDAIWVTVIVAAVLIIIMMAVWMGIRTRREMVARRRFFEATLERFNRGELDRLNPELNIANQAEFLPYDKKWEFPRELLKLDKVLGSGAFGVVRKAEAKSIRHTELVTTVAVKMVRATSSLDQMTALSRELKVLVHLGKHVNVVNLLGACTKKVSFGQLLVIVEFCRFGNLRDYLLRRRDVFIPQVDTVDENTGACSSCSVDLDPVNDSGMDTVGWDRVFAARDCSHSTDSTNTSMAVGYPHATYTDPVEPRQLINYQGDYKDEDLDLISTQDLLSWSWQVARGMKYLGFRRVVHGDLAARNILLADHNVVKICDFGLAKTLYEDENHHTKEHGPLPVKWLAIESLRDHVFSFHSDVWAYGVVLWEFFSLAETPYPGIRHDTLYKKLADGFRMLRPEYATPDIYKTMLRCWNAEPSQRPSFAELANSIGDLLDENVKTEYFDLSGPYERMNARDLELRGRDYLAMTPSENTSNTIEETQV